MQDNPLMIMPVKRKDGTYALRLGVAQGLLGRSMMRRIMDVMDKYDLPSLRSTTGQRFNLEGVLGKDLDAVIDALGVKVEKAPPNVAVCPGREQCKFGIQPSREIGERLLALIKAHAPYPYKIKSGVSGCKMACALSFVRDIGLVATAKGWDVHFGGCATRHAGLGIQLGSELTMEDALKILEKALVYYKENGRKRERTSAMLRRIGAETVSAALI